MQRILVLFWLAFALMVPASAAQMLTEASLQTMSGELRKALDYRDINGIMRYYAPDAVITLDFIQDRRIRKVYKRSEYQRLLLEGWDLGRTLTYKIRDQSIRLAGDGQSAVITNLMVATSSLKGSRYFCQTRQKFGVVLREGVPTIKLHYGEVTCE